MARGRMISNAITQDKRISQLSDDTSRLAYTWLITFADAEGRTHGDPAVVRSMLFPRREDITIAQMEGYIRGWADCGLIIWYEAKGDMWIYFPAFFNHNIVNKTREAVSKIPPPPPNLVASNSGVTPDQLPIKLNQIKLNQIKLNQSNPDDDDKSSSITPNIFQLYEQNIGMIQPLLVDELKDTEKEYPAQWIQEAFTTAVNANARNWAYVHKCLVNRKAGYIPGKNGNRGKQPAMSESEMRAKYREASK